MSFDDLLQKTNLVCLTSTWTADVPAVFRSQEIFNYLGRQRRTPTGQGQEQARGKSNQGACWMKEEDEQGIRKETNSHTEAEAAE